MRRAERCSRIARAARRSRLSARGDQCGTLEETPVFDRAVDANEVLHDDAACAKIEMPDLTVSHLAFRETDGETGRVQQGTRVAGDERVPSRSSREGDGYHLGPPTAGARA